MNEVGTIRESSLQEIILFVTSVQTGIQYGLNEPVAGVRKPVQQTDHTDRLLV